MHVYIYYKTFNLKKQFIKLYKNKAVVFVFGGMLRARGA